MCLCCAVINGATGLCDSCHRTLVPAPTYRVPGVMVRCGFLHEGAARRLVHRLKYQGVLSAVEPLAERLASIIVESGDRPEALVPVPWAVIRRGIYGVDPAEVLAAAVSARTGVPVMAALAPAWWWPRHAKRGKQCPPPRLRALRARLPSRVALVDDVVTTGTTVGAASRLLGGLTLAYAATLGGSSRPTSQSGYPEYGDK